MGMEFNSYIIEDDGDVDFEEYPAITTEDLLREIAPAYRTMSNEDISLALTEVLSGMSPEDVEGFFSSLGKIAKRAGRTLVHAAPSILPVVGGAVGTLVGGPAGTAIGTALGRFAGSAVGRATAGRGGSRQVRTAAPRQRGVRTRRTRQAQRSDVARQLLSLVQNPAFLQSLVGRVMGDSQASTVNIGAESVAAPFGAFMNALEHLAQEAAAEAHVAGAGGSAMPEYLVSEDGQPIVDVGDSEARASRLLRLLGEEQWLYPETMVNESDDYFDEAEAVGMWLQDASR